MEYLDELKKKFDGLIQELKDEFSTIRTNRPTPKLIEDIKAEYVEQSLTIKQLGSIGIEHPRSLIVTPWDVESGAQVAKAIEEANLGLSVAVQGNVVRITLPDLTNERRDELSRIVKTTAEKIRIKMRTLREEVHRKVNQEPDNDDKFRGKENLQKIVDNFNGAVDKQVEDKLKEIRE